MRGQSGGSTDCPLIQEVIKSTMRVRKGGVVRSDGREESRVDRARALARLPDAVLSI